MFWGNSLLNNLRWSTPMPSVLRQWKRGLSKLQSHRFFSCMSYFNFAGHCSHCSHHCPSLSILLQLLWWLTRNCDPVFTSFISLCIFITLHLMWVLVHFKVFPVFHTISQMFPVWPNPKCIFAKLPPLQSVYISKKTWAICFHFIGYNIQNLLW